MNFRTMRHLPICLLSLILCVPLYAQQKPDKVEAAPVEEVIRPAESSEYSVEYAKVAHAVLTPKTPLSALPSRKITERYFITDRIDTLSIAYKYDSITKVPQAFSYKPAYEEFGQLVAIERKRDWLVLDWRHFKLASPAGLQMSWIDIDGKGSMELMFSLVNDGNVEQSLGSRTSPVTGNEYNTHSQWKRAKGFCILNVDDLDFIVDNVYTGYEYSYQQSRYVKGPKSGTGYVYPDSYDTDREKKTMSVWYDFTISEGKNLIKIQQTVCQETLISDKSKQYVIKKTNSEPHQEKVEYTKNKCTPMYEEGVYIFK